MLARQTGPTPETHIPDDEEAPPRLSGEVMTKIEAAFAERDLRAVGWLWLEGLTRSLDERNGARAAAWARLIHTLGQTAEENAERATEALLYGRLMNGLAPLDDEQWAMAEDTFDAVTVEDFRENWRRTGQEAHGASAGE